MKLIQHFPASYRMSSVFADFVELPALSINNNAYRRQFDSRKMRYLDVDRKYIKEVTEVFPRMLSELILSLHNRVGVARKSAESGG